MIRTKIRLITLFYYYEFRLEVIILYMISYGIFHIEYFNIDI